LSKTDSRWSRSRIWLWVWGLGSGGVWVGLGGWVGLKWVGWTGGSGFQTGARHDSPRRSSDVMGPNRSRAAAVCAHLDHLAVLHGRRKQRLPLLLPAPGVLQVLPAVDADARQNTATPLRRWRCCCRCGVSGGASGNEWWCAALHAAAV